MENHPLDDDDLARTHKLFAWLHIEDVRDGFFRYWARNVDEFFHRFIMVYLH